MKSVILLLTVALLAGCFSINRIPAEHRAAFETLEGTWQEIGGETTVIKRIGNRLEVSSIIDSDDEEFMVRDASFENGVFEWTYFVPSTQYVVTMRTTTITPHQLECTWKNEFTSSTETLYRKE